MKKLLLSLASFTFLFASVFGQVYSPVSTTGYNIDGIAESYPAAGSTSQAIDGSDYVLYTAAYGTTYGSGSGLPDNGTITSGTRTYQLQPYTQNNILYMSAGQTDSLVLSTPAPFAAVSLLAISTEGSSTDDITLLFTDGTTMFFSGEYVADWFTGGNTILSGFDRAGRGTNLPDFLSGDPNMYSIDMTIGCANWGKLLRSITVTNTGTNARTCVFALSGVAVPVLSPSTVPVTCYGVGNGKAIAKVVGGLIPFTYSWSTAPTQTTDTATGLAPGIYSVTATDPNGCTITGINIDTITQPSAPLTISVTVSASTICLGTSATLTAHGAYTYTWTASTATDSSISVAPTGHTIYHVTGTSTTGCTASDSITVDVHPHSAISYSVSSLDSICPGTSVTLTGTGAVSYAWSGGVTNGTAFTPAVTAVYHVTATDAYSCTYPDSVKIALRSSPTVTVTTPVYDTVCAGTSYTLTGIGAGTYTWSGGVINAIPFTTVTSGTYTVTGTDSHGCTAIASVSLTLNPKPAITATVAPSDTLCAGSVVVLNGIGAVSFSWSGGITDGTPFTATQTTSYVVIGTDAKGCTNTTSVSVKVTPLPTITVTASPSDTVCTGSSVTLSGAGAVSYSWSGGVANGVAFTPTASGSYTLTGTDANGCVGTGTASLVVHACAAGIQEVATLDATIYPNPNTGAFTLTLNNVAEQMLIDIADIQGRTVYTSVEKNVQAGYTRQISIADATAGIYILHIKIGAEQYTQKISIQ